MSGAPLGSIRTPSPSGTRQPPISQSQCSQPLANGQRPLTREAAVASGTAVPLGANTPPVTVRGPAWIAVRGLRRAGSRRSARWWRRSPRTSRSRRRRGRASRPLSTSVAGLASSPPAAAGTQSLNRPGVGQRGHEVGRQPPLLLDLRRPLGGGGSELAGGTRADQESACAAHYCTRHLLTCHLLPCEPHWCGRSDRRSSLALAWQATIRPTRAACSSGAVLARRRCATAARPPRPAADAAPPTPFWPSSCW